MASVKSGWILLSFLVMTAVSSSYAQAEKEKAPERTLPKAYFPSKFRHSIGVPSTFPSTNRPSDSVADNHIIAGSVSKLALKLRRAKVSALPSSKPPPYPKLSGNPIVPYFPFAPSPQSLHPPNIKNPPVACNPEKPPKGQENPKIPYFPYCYLAPPPPKLLPSHPPKHHKPRNPPISGNPTVPYYPFFTPPPPPPLQ